MATSIINSDDGVVSGTSGLKTTGGNDGVLYIQNNGTTAVTVASTGNATFAQNVAVTGSLSVAGSNISAANSMGFRNRIINGDMRIDQRNAGASVTATSSFPFSVDRWWGYEDGTGSFTMQRSTTAPTGFTNSVVLTVSSADTSLGAAEQYIFNQSIEGLNVSDLGWGTANAKTVTLSFWVRSSVTGTYPVAVINSASNRSYVSTYTISSANTFEYKTITIPGDTSGTWLTDNGIGLMVRFSLGAGSDFQITANQWNASYELTTSSCTNLMATNGATWYITGVQLEVGSVATEFERRPYGTELALCQRYYQYDGSTTPFVGNTTSGSTYGGNVFFRTSMRAAPTVTQTHVTSSGFPGTTPTSSEITTEKFWSTKASDGTGNGNFYKMTWVATAEL